MRLKYPSGTIVEAFVDHASEPIKPPKELLDLMNITKEPERDMQAGPLTGRTREYWRYHFAGQAMYAFIRELSFVKTDGFPRPDIYRIAKYAKKQADALLAELEKPCSK